MASVVRVLYFVGPAVAIAVLLVMCYRRLKGSQPMTMSARNIGDVLVFDFYGIWSKSGAEVLALKKEMGRVLATHTGPLMLCFHDVTFMRALHMNLLKSATEQVREVSSLAQPVAVVSPNARVRWVVESAFPDIRPYETEEEALRQISKT